MNVDDLRPIDLFDGLSAEQLAELVSVGDDVPIAPGAELFHEGDHADHWWMIVDGAITLLRRVGDSDAEVGKMDKPGLWSGGFRAWNEQGVYLATGVGAAEGRALRVPAAALRELLNGWFPFGTHLVAGLHGTAHSIESNARQRESLITLGTLSAGLAHELNNPAAAAVRAVDALQATSAALQSALARLAGAGITASQFQTIDALRAEIVEPTANAAASDPLEVADPLAVADPLEVADPLAVADREDRLTGWLDAHGVDESWDIAPPLATAGVDTDWCARLLDAAGADAISPAIAWVARSVTIRDLLAEVKESTGRISRLVGAIRSHSQMDRAAQQTTDVTEGLESTLLILGHKLRDGITVVRNFPAERPRIDAFPGELNQVWTNLVDNAIDAMDGHGTLTLTVRTDDESVFVDIADDGTGMPPEVQKRAFEAFYTTKDVGKGTGLGLDIARRIVVERHHGTIDIDSHPGTTVLRVRLPR